MKQFIGAMLIGVLITIAMVTVLVSFGYHDTEMTEGEMVSVISSERAGEEGLFISQVSRTDGKGDTIQVFTKTRYVSGSNLWMRLHIRQVGINTIYTEYKL